MNRSSVFIVETCNALNSNKLPRRGNNITWYYHSLPIFPFSSSSDAKTRRFSSILHKSYEIPLDSSEIRTNESCHRRCKIKFLSSCKIRRNLTILRPVSNFINIISIHCSNLFYFTTYVIRVMHCYLYIRNTIITTACYINRN